MSETKAIILQGTDIKKLQEDLSAVLRNNIQPPLSVTQSQSAMPVIGSRMGWENMVTITMVYPGEL
jgi:hypothetical protein